MPKTAPAVREDHKWCFKCHQGKPHDAFYANRRNRDGLYYCCRECVTKAAEGREERRQMVEAAAARIMAAQYRTVPNRDWVEELG